MTSRPAEPRFRPAAIGAAAAGHRASAACSGAGRAWPRPAHRDRIAATLDRGATGRGSAPSGTLRAAPRRDSAPPAVALFAQPAVEPAAPPRNPAQPERRVVGFGDDLPAFLARAPRVAARA